MISAGSTILASDFVSTPAPGAGDSGKVVKLDAVGKIPTGFLRFGGDGSDGALTISSGITTIDLASAATVVKNYTSISITGTGALAFSNPATNGSKIILKSQGDVTLTSSATRLIDLRSLGSVNGTVTIGTFLSTSGGASGGSFLASGSYALAAGGLLSMSATATLDIYGMKYPGLFISTSGGGGGATADGGSTATPGAGGRGAGTLVIECAGALNFTGTIDASGANGTNGSVTGTSAAAGGGGGGGGGCVQIFYNSLTVNSGTITVAGGTAGSGATGGVGNRNAQGGAGGGSRAGGGDVAGLSSGGGTSASAGGTGGAGSSLVAKNTEYA